MGCAVDVPTDKRAISSAVQPGGSIVCLPRGAGVGFGVFVSLTEVTFAIPAYPGMPSSTRLISCNSAARIEDVRTSRVTLKDVVENTETRTDRDSRPNSTPDLFTESAVRIIDLDDDVGVPPVVERHDVAGCGQLGACHRARAGMAPAGSRRSIPRLRVRTIRR
jgi:hypothetical protein